MPLALALLRGFARDRGALLFALFAPLAFGALFGMLYTHLDSRDGIRFSIALVVADDCSPPSRKLAEAILARSGGRLVIERAKEPAARADAVIRIPPSDAAAGALATIESRYPLPGLNDAVRLLVEAAHAEASLHACGGTASPLPIEDLTQRGMLLRRNAAGIPVLFALFAISSLAARGLGDDAAGLRDRLASLGVSRRKQLLSIIGAWTVVASVQMTATFAMLAAVFGVLPVSAAGLAVAAVASAAAIASTISLLAEVAGSRARFAAAAPIVALVLGGLSGSMVPVEILPEALAAPSRWLFTRWCIEACAAALEDGAIWSHVAQLGCWTVACTAVLWIAAPRLAGIDRGGTT
jgi:hypothetical protein